MKKNFQLLFALVLIVPSLFGQTNSYQYKKSQHQKEVIGYFTQWDAWKGVNHGVATGFYNQLNIDYSQYTMLNWSFFGVALDGSLHSGDLRDPNIHQPNVNQQPGPLLLDDIYSSWDYWLLYGELETIQYLPIDLDLQPNHANFWVYTAHGYKGDPSNATGWINTNTGETGSYPLPLPKPNGAKGVMELAHDNNVKLMASIGGWSMSKHFPQVTADSTKRAKFIADCVKLINMGFDGIDIDWEFPGAFSGMNFTGSQADYANFQVLMEEIRVAIGPNKLITAAFNTSPTKLAGFNWAALDTTMDYFNMMSYDMHGGWNNTAGHNSPLYPYPGEEAGSESWSHTFDYLVSQGVDPQKINMGVAFYGRGVITNGNAALNAPTVKVQKNISPDGLVQTAADYTNWSAFDGTPTHYSIDQDINNGWTQHWDSNAVVPYLTKGNYFLSYDNEQSIAEKAKYVNQNDIGGVIIWHAFGDLNPGTITQTYANKLPYSPTTTAPLANTLNRIFALNDTSVTVPPTPASLLISINSPNNGQQFFQQSLDSIQISIEITDSVNGVASSTFIVNGNTVSFGNQGHIYQYEFLPQTFGIQTLQVQAVSNAGDTVNKQTVFSVSQLTTTGFGQLLSSNDWDTLFPHRNGDPLNGGNDFYSYTNFLAAIKSMSNITVSFERKCSSNLYKITRTDKTTGISSVIRKDAGFDANTSQVITEVVDYANFASNGTNEERTRELLAFLANISQETTGGWATAPGGRYAWGLYFNEEVGYSGTSNVGYVDAGNTSYPPISGKSYHGRGPIQLSWNYNYGQVSEFLFGDKNVLLANPDSVTSSGSLAFQTALWFWMTPQYPKPSCHDVMAGNWQANATQTSNGLIAGFGATVNIINGGIECNSGVEIAKVQHRIGHYSRFTSLKNIGKALDGSNSPIELGCANMPQFQIDYQECTSVAGIFFSAPVNGGSISISLGDTIPVMLQISDPNNELSGFALIVEGTTLSGTNTLWVPSAFGTFTHTAFAIKLNGDTLFTSTTVDVIDETTSTGCSSVTPWDVNAVYATPNQEVFYKNAVYFNKWWTQGETPGNNQVWEFDRNCSGTTSNTAPIISSVQPSNTAQFDLDSLTNFNISFIITDAENNLASVSAQVNSVTVTLTQIGNSYTSSYVPPGTGIYTLAITALDSLNAQTSYTSTFEVSSTGTSFSKSEISIISPTNGSNTTLQTLSSLPISFVVSDSVNSISSVTLLLNGTILPFASTGTNYTATFSANAFGNQTLSITAVNSIGESTVVSSTFSITQDTSSSTHCGRLTWVAQTYATPNTEVFYNQKIYRNKWYAAANETPGVDQVWEFVSNCGTINPNTNNCGYSAYDSTAVYAQADMHVFYNGKIYKSKWWVTNQQPDISAAWDYVQDCTPGASPYVYPNPVSTLLNVITYKAVSSFQVNDVNVGQTLLTTQSAPINVQSLNSRTYILNIVYTDGTTDGILFTKQ